MLLEFLVELCFIFGCIKLDWILLPSLFCKKQGTGQVQRCRFIYGHPVSSLAECRTWSWKCSQGVLVNPCLASASPFLSLHMLFEEYVDYLQVESFWKKSIISLATLLSLPHSLFISLRILLKGSCHRVDYRYVACHFKKKSKNVATILSGQLLMLYWEREAARMKLISRGEENATIGRNFKQLQTKFSV